MPRTRLLHVADNPGDEAWLIADGSHPRGLDVKRRAFWATACGADKAITTAIDTPVENEKRKNGNEGQATGTVS
jgi:hypothetical protein